MKWEYIKRDEIIMNDDPRVFSGDKHVDQVINTYGKTIRVGQCGVTDIIYHTPLCDGDRHFIDVFVDNKRVYRQFNIDEISWPLDS